MVRNQWRQLPVRLAGNERLVGAIAEDLTAAEAASFAQGDAARRFADFARRTLNSLRRPCRVVAQAEHPAKGANPRFVVTSLPASTIDSLRGRLLRPR